MADFKEILDQFSLTYAEKEITGNRVFIQDTNGQISTGGLPVVGADVMVTAPATSAGVPGANIGNCLCRRSTSRYEAGILRVTCTYSTKEQKDSGSGGDPVSHDTDSRRWDFSSEEIFLNPTEPGSGSATPDQSNVLVVPSWYWDPANDLKVDVPVPRFIGNNRFSQSISGLTSIQKDLFIARENDHLGTINSAAFEGFAEGQVRFDGASGGSEYNVAGALTFSFELTFTARLLKPHQAAIVSDDWLYLWDPADGTFRKPTDGAGAVFLYNKTNFSDLLASYPDDP